MIFFHSNNNNNNNSKVVGKYKDEMDKKKIFNSLSYSNQKHTLIKVTNNAKDVASRKIHHDCYESLLQSNKKSIKFGQEKPYFLYDTTK